MLKLAMQTWRRHPILVALGGGAVFGALYATLTEVDGILHGGSSAVLPLLLPNPHGSHVSQMTAVQTAGLLLIEVAGNMVGFAVLFSAPVAIVVGIRLLIRGKRP
jgi:hypothetical protein